MQCHLCIDRATHRVADLNICSECLQEARERLHSLAYPEISEFKTHIELYPSHSTKELCMRFGRGTVLACLLYVHGSTLLQERSETTSDA